MKNLTNNLLHVTVAFLSVLVFCFSGAMAIEGELELNYDSQISAHPVLLSHQTLQYSEQAAELLNEKLKSEHTAPVRLHESLTHNDSLNHWRLYFQFFLLRAASHVRMPSNIFQAWATTLGLSGNPPPSPV
ncbi:MAG: hypothetical protein NTV34_19605 [Proteobacteria bacterium]|nr:hypothetical protein [Pseudomonadota bacterium]